MHLYANRLRTEGVVFQKKLLWAIGRMLHKGLALVLNEGLCVGLIETHDKAEATPEMQVS